MKIGGKKLPVPSTITVVIPRDEGPIVFKCQPILDFEPFEALVPFPKPPVIQKLNAEPFHDVEDQAFKEKLVEYAKMKSNWMFITSLRATPDLEWEEVDYSKPETWDKASVELLSCLVSREVDMVIRGVQQANALDDAKLQEARDSFLSSLQTQLGK